MSLLNKYAEVNRRATELEALGDKKLIKAIDSQKVAPQINQSKVNRISIPPLPQSLYIEAELANKRSQIAGEKQGLPTPSLTPLQRTLFVRRSQVEQLFTPEEISQIQLIQSDLTPDEYIKRVLTIPSISQKIPYRIGEDAGEYMNRIRNLIAQSDNPDEILRRQINAEKQQLRQKLLTIMDDIEADNILNNSIMTTENILLLNKSFDGFLKQLKEKYSTLDISTFIQAVSFWLNKLDKIANEPVKLEGKTNTSSTQREEYSLVFMDFNMNDVELLLKGNNLAYIQGSLKKDWDKDMTEKERKELKSLLSKKYDTTIKNKTDIKKLIKVLNEGEEKEEEEEEEEEETIKSGDGIKRGRGIENKYAPFGKYLISLSKLDEGKLYVVHHSKKAFSGMPIRMISDEAVIFIKDLLQYNRFTHKLFDKLKPIEQRLLQQAITKSGLKQHLGLDTDSSNDKEILNRYLVLMGEYQGGNDSPVVKKELRHIIGHFIKTGKMSKAEGLTHYNELI